MYISNRMLPASPCATSKHLLEGPEVFASVEISMFKTGVITALISFNGSFRRRVTTSRANLTQICVLNLTF